MLTEMAQGAPDVIVFELGDGLLGTYGVQSILQQPDIKDAITAVVLSANDPVAAWGGVKLLRERFSIEPAAVTGPRPTIRWEYRSSASSWGRGLNAVSNPAELGDFLIARLGLQNVGEAKAVGT